MLEQETLNELKKISNLLQGLYINQEYAEQIKISSDVKTTIENKG